MSETRNWRAVRADLNVDEELVASYERLIDGALALKRDVEYVAEGILYALYPNWMRRWGWTEATEDMKHNCRREAEQVLAAILPIDKS